MKKYVALISGINAKVEMAGCRQRCSFHTTRYLEAEDANAAREVARLVIERELEGVILNKSDDPLVIFVDWMKEVESFAEYENLPYKDAYSWHRE